MSPCYHPYVADNDVWERDAGVGGFPIVKHVVQKVDVTFSDLPVATLLWNHIVRRHVDNKVMTSVKSTSNHRLFVRGAERLVLETKSRHGM